MRRAIRSGRRSSKTIRARGRPPTANGSTRPGSTAIRSLRYSLYELVEDVKTPLGTLTAVESETRSKLHLDADATPSYGILLNDYYPLFTGGPAPAGSYLYEPLNIVTSADNLEVRFASRRLWRFEFLVGAFHTDQTNNYDIDAYGRYANGTALPAPFGNFITSVTATTYRETASFGDATFYITDKLDVTGGIRYTANEQSGSSVGSGLLFGAGGQASPLNSKGDKALYQANIRWRPVHDLSFYARVATGYRPGGPQNNPLAPTPTFGADTVTDYEIGAKGALFDHRLTFDASIYHIDWEDVQLDSLLGGIVYVGNGGTARADGVELETTFKVTHDFNVGASFGYNDAVLTKINNADTAAYIGAKDGDRLPNSPKITFAAYGDYSFPITNAVQGDVGATVRYQGDQVSAFPNDTLNIFYKIPGLRDAGPAGLGQVAALHPAHRHSERHRHQRLYRLRHGLDRARPGDPVCGLSDPAADVLALAVRRLLRSPARPLRAPRLWRGVFFMQRPMQRARRIRAGLRNVWFSSRGTMTRKGQGAASST